jgi:hypothetical protein
MGRKSSDPLVTFSLQPPCVPGQHHERVVAGALQAARSGDRQANSALWRIALVRMGCHRPTKDHVARRTAEGKTKTKIMRCLKRYIAREVFPHLLVAAPGR